MDIYSIFAVVAFGLSLFNTYILLRLKQIKPQDVASFLQLLIEVLQLLKSNPVNSQSIDSVINLIKKELEKYQ